MPRSGFFGNTRRREAVDRHSRLGQSIGGLHKVELCLTDFHTRLGRTIEDLF